ncbi:MAG: cell division protein FtsZ, partial [Oscillospiraceae bacterium]
SSAAHPDANIIWGAAFDDSYKDEMRITVIATGFESAPGVMPVTAAASQPASAPMGFGGVPISFAGDNKSAVSANDAAIAQAAQEQAKKEEEDDNSFYDDVITLLNNRTGK